MHVADIITVEWNVVAAGSFRMWVTIKKNTQWHHNRENTLRKAPEYCWPQQHLKILYAAHHMYRNCKCFVTTAGIV
jgi:hypothetical protein